MLFSNGVVWTTECPHFVTVGLDLIGEMISDGEYSTDPTSNVGAEYVNNVFQMRSYCWCDGDREGHENGCPPNFEHGDFAVSWYKHSHRGSSCSRIISRGEWWAIVRECVDSVLAEKERK